MDYDEEYNQDNAGCCICYNKTMSAKDESQITMCDECEKYSHAYDTPEVKDDGYDGYIYDTEGY
jgi:hypothetical protein